MERETKEGALSRAFQRVAALSTSHRPPVGAAEHLAPSSHAVEARSLPGRSQVLWAQGQGRKAATSRAGGWQCLLEESHRTCNVRQPTEQRRPVVSCRERLWSTWMTSWRWRRPASPQQPKTFPSEVQETQILCLFPLNGSSC